MTLKVIAFIEKDRAEYVNVLKHLINVTNFEIINFVSSDNCSLTIDGIPQFSGSLMNSLQQTKCDAVLTFAINDMFVDIISKLQWNENKLYVIFIPITMLLHSFKRLIELPWIIVYTCLPFRHLNCVWRARRSVLAKGTILQCVEAGLVAPTLCNRNSFFGCQSEININNFYRLIMIDAIQFICERTMFKVQAVNRSIQWETREEHKNEKLLDDYCIVVGHFRPRENDTKRSLTSQGGSALLSPRTGLVKVECTPADVGGLLSFKVKIKTSTGTLKVSETGSTPTTLFWTDRVVLDGVEAFVRQVECVRLQGTPRLVDLGTVNEEDVLVARGSLATAIEVERLCKVVAAADGAALCGQTTFVE